MHPDATTSLVIPPYTWLQDGRGPVLSGRMIRVHHLQAMHAAGQSPERIAGKYLQLSVAEVEDALKVKCGPLPAEMRHGRHIMSTRVEMRERYWPYWGDDPPYFDGGPWR